MNLRGNGRDTAAVRADFERDFPALRLCYSRAKKWPNGRRQVSSQEAHLETEGAHLLPFGKKKKNEDVIRPSACQET